MDFSMFTELMYTPHDELILILVNPNDPETRFFCVGRLQQTSANSDMNA
jgi:hypothetical protein